MPVELCSLVLLFEPQKTPKDAEWCKVTAQTFCDLLRLLRFEIAFWRRAKAPGLFGILSDLGLYGRR